MKAFKKIIAAALVLAILTASLCSCDLLFGSMSAEELVAEADAALAQNDHTIVSSIQYLYEGEANNDGINTPVIATEVDGDNFRISMSLDGETTDNGVIYTYVDGTLYTQLSENGVATNTPTVIDDAAKAELTASYGSIVGIEDFEVVETTAFGKNGMITCADMKDETINDMIEFLENQLDLDGATVAVKESALVITTLSGMYVSNIFTCQYIITTETDAYTLTMTYASAYLYDDVTITAPDFN